MNPSRLVIPGRYVCQSIHPFYSIDVVLGPLRCGLARCALHQLCRILHRMQDPRAEAQETIDRQSEGGGQVSTPAVLTDIPRFDGLGSDERDAGQDHSPRTETQQPYQQSNHAQHTSSDGAPFHQLSKAQEVQRDERMGVLTQFMKPKFARAPIKEAGRVAYLGESSNLSLLVHDRHGTTDVVHYPLPENIAGSQSRLTEPDQQEIDILQQKGAFLLPPRSLCDELVNCYFKWVAPVVPMINRSRFMRRYHDPDHPPSLLLLQAVLLAGSRVCHDPQLMDANGSSTPAAMTFYKRAKALYEANYEDDRITIVQALTLMGWYSEGPEGD